MVSSDNLYKSTLTNKLSHGNDSEAIYKSLLDGDLYHTLWGRIYKKTLFADYTYDTFKHQTNSEDGILFYQLIVNCTKICTIPDIVYFYYYNPVSSTKNATDRQLKQVIFGHNYMLKIVTDADIDKDLRDKSTIRLLVMFLKSTRKRNYYFSLFNNIDLPDLLSFKSLKRFYSHRTLLVNYLILHSWLFRSCYIALLKIKIKIYS